MKEQPGASRFVAIALTGVVLCSSGSALAASSLRLACFEEQKMPGRALVCEYSMLTRLNNQLADLHEELVKSGKAGKVDVQRWISARDACADVDCVDGALEASIREAKKALEGQIHDPSVHTGSAPAPSEEKPETTEGPVAPAVAPSAAVPAVNPEVIAKVRPTPPDTTAKADRGKKGGTAKEEGGSANIPVFLGAIVTLVGFFWYRRRAMHPLSWPQVLIASIAVMVAGGQFLDSTLAQIAVSGAFFVGLPWTVIRIFFKPAPYTFEQAARRARTLWIYDERDYYRSSNGRSTKVDFEGFHDAVAQGGVVQYQLSSDRRKRYGELLESFALLKQAKLLSRVAGEEAYANHDRKRHSGATSGLDIEALDISIGQSHGLICNEDLATITSKDGSLVFLPDAVYLNLRDKAQRVAFERLSADLSFQGWICDDGPPSDAKPAGTAWKYTNRDGGPDLRFADNVELAVIEAAYVTLSIGRDWRFRIQTSRQDAAKATVSALVAQGAKRSSESRFKEQPQDEPQEAQDEQGPADSRSAWLRALELTGNAGPEEIRAAYRRLMQQYHPDKYMNAGKDIQEVALKRTREINAAYKALQ
jgi:uncharacterized protein